MLNGIQHSLGQQELTSQIINPTVATVATAQDTIGWDQILKGQLAHEWKISQQEALTGTEAKYKNAQTWTTKVIQTIFELWLELWKIRNEAQHGYEIGNHNA
jgi:hypothetical protein